MQGSKIYDELCYREEFSTEVKTRFVQIIKKLFEHPLWVQEAVQNEIAKTNTDAIVAGIFQREGLDYIYLTKM